MIDEKWPRWLWSSIAKHFDAERQNIPLYIEGDFIPNAIPREGAELRINGPLINTPSKGYTLASIDINVLLNITPDNEDAYKLWRVIGIFITAFTKPIKIWNYGDGTDDGTEGSTTDDNTLLGCLKLVENRGDEIVISHFGHNPDIKMIQTTIDAYYEIEVAN